MIQEEDATSLHFGEEGLDRSSADQRTYVIIDPQHPLEPQGERVLPGNVVRTVDYLGNGAKVVTWDYTGSTF